MCGGNDTGFFGWVEFIDPPVVSLVGCWYELLSSPCVFNVLTCLMPRSFVCWVIEVDELFN